MQMLNLPEGLHIETKVLIIKFAEALGHKLLLAQSKHGYSVEWKNPNNVPFIQLDLEKHMRKGDPLDVAAYCAFLEYHGAATCDKAISEGYAYGVRLAGSRIEDNHVKAGSLK